MRFLLYGRIQFLGQIGSMLGPIVSVVLYVYLGDSWSLKVLEWVMVSGLMVTGFSGIFLLFFSDAITLKVRFRMGDFGAFFSGQNDCLPKIELRRAHRKSLKVFWKGKVSNDQTWEQGHMM